MRSILVSFELNDAWDDGSTNVPCWGAVERLGSVVVAFAVTAHVQDFVLDVPTALAIQAEDLVLEALPLGLLVFGVVLGVCVVCLIDETEVCSRLQVLSAFIARRRLSTYIVESRRDGLWVILKEKTCDGSIINVRWPVVRLTHSDQGKHRHKEHNRFESHIESDRRSIRRLVIKSSNIYTAYGKPHDGYVLIGGSCHDPSILGSW